MKRLLVLLPLVVCAVAAGISVSRASASQLIYNGGFENGLSGWQSSSALRTQYIYTTTVVRHSGQRSARFCGANLCSERLSQTISIPSLVKQAQLTFWVYVASSESQQSVCHDRLVGQLLSTGGTVLGSSTAVCNGTTNSTWIQESLDLSAGLSNFHGSALIRFLATTDSLYSTIFYLDDVALNVTVGSPTSTPTPTATPTNSGSGSSGAVQISSDPYPAGTAGQHRTEVEPDTFAFGNTLVAAFQVGRIYDGGATDIGWATSINGTWQHGLLPGLTTNSSPAGPFDRVSDASVAYDARHGVWMILSLDLMSSSVVGVGVSVNTSTDGLTWNNPVLVSTTSSGDYDKTWITCDDTASSPFYGHCYAEWDNYGNGDTILMSTSTDGGQTWSAPSTTADDATGLGGQPLVQPNGTVVVPIASAFQGGLMAFSSTNGGATWSATTWITGILEHTVSGNLRTSPLPSAAVDATGKIYVVWQDCRFESGCSANDIVMITSTDGVNWSVVSRVAADPIGSHVDHFIPGIAIKSGTSGSSAQIALSYYYYPQASCSSLSCQLDVGYTSSTDGGALWTSGQQLAGPISLSWIASTSQGLMVGDYMSTSFVGGVPVPVFAVAATPSGGLTEYMAASPQTVSAGHQLGAPLALPIGPTYNGSLFSEARRVPSAR
jgi:hypothetical protein